MTGGEKWMPKATGSEHDAMQNVFIAAAWWGTEGSSEYGFVQRMLPISDYHAASKFPTTHWSACIIIKVYLSALMLQHCVSLRKKVEKYNLAVRPNCQDLICRKWKYFFESTTSFIFLKMLTQKKKLHSKFWQFRQVPPDQTETVRIVGNTKKRIFVCVIFVSCTKRCMRCGQLPPTGVNSRFAQMPSSVRFRFRVCLIQGR